MIEIHTYQPEFVNDQFKIGKEIADKWPLAGQSPPDILRDTYSRVDFDPSTRFYAFEGDNMVGFLTSRIEPINEMDRCIASMELPFVDKSRIDYVDIENILISHALKTLRSKNCHSVLTRGGNSWPGTMDMLQRFGFTKDKSQVRVSEVIVSDFVSGNRDIEPLEFEELSINHVDQVIKLYEGLGFAEDKLREYFSKMAQMEYGITIPSPWYQKMKLIDKIVAKTDDEIVGLSLVVHKEAYDDAIAFQLILMIDPDNKEYLSLIFSQTCQNLSKKGYHRLMVHPLLSQINTDEDEFKQIGLEFYESLASYSLIL